MGVVYRAEHTILRTRVAIKDLNLQDTGEREQARHQFEGEARLLAHLQHPNIVRVSDCFKERDHLYLVMDLVDGPSLEKVLRASPGGLRTEWVLPWIFATCDVLDFLHRQQPPLVHRDLKPSNIMLDRTGRLMLVDFGIARVLGSTSTREMLSPGFSPIEQYSSGPALPSADIYALGATFYTLVTGQVPPPAVDRLQGTVALVPPSYFNPAISRELDAVVMRMMAVVPNGRYQSVRDVQAALQAASSLHSRADALSAPPVGGTGGPVVGWRPLGVSIPADVSSCGVEEPPPIPGGFTRRRIL